VNRREFETLVGRPPDQDDLHRANCTQAGDVGHLMCGLCYVCNQPKFVCGGIWGHSASMKPPKPFEVHGENENVPRFHLELTGLEGRDLHFAFLDGIEWEGPLRNDLQREALEPQFIGAPITKETRLTMIHSVLSYLMRMVECEYLQQHTKGDWTYNRPDKDAASLEAAERRANELRAKYAK